MPDNTDIAVRMKEYEVSRSVVMVEDMPVITKVQNRAEVLLMSEDPRMQIEEMATCNDASS